MTAKKFSKAAKKPTAKEERAALGDMIADIDKGGVDAVRAYLDKWGSKRINQTNSSKRTALQQAAALDRTDVIQLLVDNGADLTLQDNKEALTTAACFGRNNALVMLLDFGLHPDTIEACSLNTALHFAAWNRHVETVRILVARGASVFAKNEDGETPYSYTRDLSGTQIGMKDRIKIREIMDERLAELEKKAFRQGVPIDEKITTKKQITTHMRQIKPGTI